VTRPVAWQSRARRSAWVDYRSGAGVDDSGAPFVVRPSGRRTTPGVVDFLDAARAANIERVVLTGARPTQKWLEVATPGWTVDGTHFVDALRPCGRFAHDTGSKVQLRRASEWFGEGGYGPRDARDAWDLLGAAMRAKTAFREDFALRDSPSGTGQQAWAKSIIGEDAPALLTPAQAQLVRSTSTQARVEVVATERRRVPGFVYLDGRVFYAALTRELGTGPAQHLSFPSGTTYEALRAIDDGRMAYRRARYLVRFTVPDGWAHVGLLSCKLEDSDREWWCPREPGYVGETWVDSAEAELAHRSGWAMEVLEALLFTPGRPLDTWTDRLLRAREGVAKSDAPPLIRDMVRGALRLVLISTIGAFSSTGRDVTRLTTDVAGDMRAGLIPGDARLTPISDDLIKAVWREELSAAGAAFARPELASQVWGRARARVLSGQGGTGALHVPFEEVLGIRGDALYLTRDPGWPDDGKPGRLRVKGRIDDPVTAPTSIRELDALRARAERNGA
jgi:hypothetical protein